MPGWQSFHKEYKDRVEVIVIAQDAQGADIVKPLVEKAGGTYRVLLDQRNVIGKAYNLKYVPVGILIDETGCLVRSAGNVNIHDENFHRELIEWITTGSIPQNWIQADRRTAPRNLTPDEAEADARFQLAIVLLERGKRAKAIAELKRAFRLDPQNWIIRKQLWAIEHPKAFYEGDVDYGWQKEQQAREDSEGE